MVGRVPAVLPAAPPALRLAGRAGPVGRRLAGAADTARLLGPAVAWRARRDRRRPVPGSAARDQVYLDLWRQAAAAVGAVHTDLGGGFAALCRDGREVRVRHQLTPLDDPVALALALDKPRCRALLAAAGVPCPDQVTFTAAAAADAVALLRATGGVVVKPAVGTAGGDGVTSGVRTPADLHRAAWRAARHGPLLVAERQVAGDLHRVLLLEGRVLDVVTDRAPAVVGDATATVEELLRAENDRRRAAGGAGGLELLAPDLDLVLALRAQGLGLRSVPAAGQRVAVKGITNDRGPRDSTTYRGRLHDDVLRACRAAADAVGLRLAGIDVLAPALDAPLTDGVVLEVNGAPGLHRHYQVADPAAATRVAEPVLERLLSA